MQGIAVGGEANVVHRPAVDTDGGDAFRSSGCGLAEAFFNAGKKSIERPDEPAPAMDRAVGDAVNDFDLRLSVDPAEQGDAAAFCAEVDGNSCGFLHMFRPILV